MAEKQLRAFRFTPGRPPKPADVSDYQSGLDSLLEARQYRQLPSLWKEIEVFRSDIAGDKFLVKVTYGEVIYAISMADSHAFKVFTEQYLLYYPILPELLEPEVNQAEIAAVYARNHQTFTVFDRRRG